MKRIGILGIGCIGSVITKYLIQDFNHQCFLYNRSKKSNIEISYLGVLEKIPIELDNDIEIELDWLIICLKEYHFESAKPLIKKLIRPRAKVAIFRNGLDLAKDISEFTAEGNILETIIDCPIQKNSEGVLIQLNKPKITLPKSELATDFMDLFQEKEVEFKQTNNFRTKQWEKLIPINLAPYYKKKLTFKFIKNS